MLTINEIRIEDQRGGVAVVTDRIRPRFSFSMTSDRRACVLRSARVEVNGWEKEVRDQLNIQYGGPALEPFQTYCVRVTVWDDAGEEATAERLFQTGRLGLPWAGKWISDSAYQFKSPESPVPMLFRRVFTTDKPVKRLRVLATAMGIFDLTLDGKRISEDYFAPGFTDYSTQLQYVCYEMDDLPPGEHVFAAVVAGGWAVGRTTNVSNTNQSVSQRSAKRQALLAELRLQYEDGSTEVIGTDERFEVTEDTPWRFADFYDGESYDAGWDAAAVRWRPAAEEKLKVRPAIRARYGEPVTAHEVLEPVAWFRAPSGELICDFGQNIAGVIRVKLNGKAGQEIVFRHAEALENGELYVQNLRSAKQTVTYLCRDGEQEYSPRLTYMGFRYVGIRGVEQEDLEIKAVAVYSDLEQVGSFRCSNEDLNRLQSNLMWSGKDNFVDIPTDCPQRDERQGWTGDIALFASTACLNFHLLGGQLHPGALRPIPGHGGYEHTPAAVPGDEKVSGGRGAVGGPHPAQVPHPLRVPAHVPVRRLVRALRQCAGLAEKGPLGGNGVLRQLLPPHGRDRRGAGPGEGQQTLCRPGGQGSGGVPQGVPG